MAESLRCPPEMITTLFIGYIPIKNKKLKKKKAGLGPGREGKTDSCGAGTSK